MKKEKIYFIVITLLISVILLLIISIVFIINNKEEEKQIENDKKTLVCIKELDDNSEYTLTNQYIIDIDDFGLMGNYKIQSMYQYKNKTAYEEFKKNDFGTSKVEFFDSKIQLTETKTYDSTKDTWYKNYQNNLENEGYQCKEK